MIAERIEAAGIANAQLLKELEELQTSEIVNAHLVITSCYLALKRCVEAEGLNPEARKQVRSAYRMAGAAIRAPAP